MLDGEIKTKNSQFIKSLIEKRIIKQENSSEKINEENLDKLLRRTIYNRDLVLYSRAIINKKKYLLEIFLKF